MNNMIKKSQAVMLILVMVIGMFSMIEAKEVKAASTPSVSYRVHRQTYGWENYWKMDGETSGTVGQGKRLEAIQIVIIPKMTQPPNNLPADENVNGFEKNWPTNKVEMISNMGVDIDDFVSKNRDFWNVGYTDRTTGYTDGALTVSTSYDGYGLDKISWMMLRGNSNSLEWMVTRIILLPVYI